MNVTVYSSPTCPWCTKAKQFLKTHKVPFKDVDVSANTKAAASMMEKSGQSGIPVIEVDNSIIVGYDEGALKKALKIK